MLYGGRSGEHEVSLMSAKNVIEYLDRSRFEVVPVGIDKQGVWFLGDETHTLPQAADRMLFKPNAIGKHVQHVQASKVFSAKSTERVFDVIFPVIHGTLCEDGTVQGLLELADVPYVGCGVLSSAMGMDKDVSKRLIHNAGLRVPSYVVIKRGEWEKHAKTFCEKIIKTLGFPVFVKPSNTGSSVGVEKIKHAEDLIDAIEKAFLYDVKVVVEKGINAHELEVAVLESKDYGSDPIVSVVGEVRPTHEFYSYAAKYLDQNGAELIIPATFPKEVLEKVRVFAKDIFNVLECEGMARVDLFLEKDTHEIYFNEINTIPGFTAISMYPKLMGASGVSYSELLTHLVELAIARHKRKTALCREYQPE